MSSDQLPLPAAPLHRNQQLFSDHYLDVLLPQRGDWRLLAAEVGTIRSRVAAIVAGFTPSKNEAQTEHELVRPILAALGHTFEAQAPLATPLGTKKPDYVFYRDVAALNANKKFDAWLAHADDLARRQRFFHWELEFPEAFFDRHGQPLGECAGFDAVIGNPPYVRQEALAPLKPFLAADFAEMYQGTADLFVYFFAQGMRQLREGGRLSYIASNSWLRANYASALRTYLRSQATVETLVDVGDNRVFADAPDVYPAVLVVRKAPPADYTARAAVFTRGEGVKQFASQVAAKLAPVSIHDQPDSGWQLGDDAGRRIFAKLMAGGRPLGEVVDNKIYYWDRSQPWPGRKPGAYEWYEVQDTVDYYRAFDTPKVFWPDIAKSPRFAAFVVKSAAPGWSGRR